MFDRILSGTFDDPEFKEDSVREEIVAPIIRRLGYTPSGPNRVVRGRSLVHPFVMIGSKKHGISIIPDYLLVISDRTEVVLDAKSPLEEIVKTRHVEQAYSYAIHPDVRASLYGLCNGRRLVVWDREHVDPVLDIVFDEFDSKWSQIERVLSPAAVVNPLVRDFLPDLGMSMLKAGYGSEDDAFWAAFPITWIGRTTDDLYTASSDLSSFSLETGLMEAYCVSLELSEAAFGQLVECSPPEVRTQLSTLLSRQPYSGALKEPFEVAIRARLSRPTRGLHEEFVPFVVSLVRPAIHEPEELAAWLVSLGKEP